MGLLALLVVLAGRPVSGQATAEEPPKSLPPASAAPTSGDLDLVKRALTLNSTLNLRDEQLRFYTRVSATPPATFAEYAKGYDLWNGPTKGGNPMSHQEFVNMVTPRELYGSGGIKATELLQFAFTNWLGQTLVRRGLEELKEAKTEREAREIRERIDRELSILKGGER